MIKTPKTPKTPKLSKSSDSLDDDPSPPSTPHLSPYNNPSHFNQLSNLGMKIRSSVYKGYYTTPTSSPNQDIHKQQQLYTNIHPPATPSIFSSASQTLSVARSCLEYTSNDDVFSSPLPLAPTHGLKRSSKSHKSRYNHGDDSDSDIEEVSNMATDTNTDNRPIRGLKGSKHQHTSYQHSSSPNYTSPPSHNLISSPTYNKLNNFNLESSSPERDTCDAADTTQEPNEPWKHINYSLYADIPVNESMF